MKKKILFIISIILLSLFMINNVYAKEVVDADNNITQEGDYDSNRFIAGNNIINKANIDGLSFIAGNDIKVEGKSTYDFIAGNNITINENIEKDLFVAGNIITIGEDAVIGRDIYIAGSTITIKKNVERDLRVVGDSIDLSGITINGDAKIYTDNIILDKDTVIKGKLSYSEDSNIKGLKKATINSVKVIKSKEVNNKKDIGDKIFDFISNVAACFIVMAVLFFLLPKTLDKLNNVELEVGKILKNIGIGIIFIIVVPIISLVALFSGVLTPIALITFALYIIFIYLASLLVYYIVGKLIISKTVDKNNTYLSLLSGIIIVKIIKLIPVIGGIVSAIVLFYGMGLIYNYVVSIRNNKKK